jgi:hypothetical protein
MGAYAHPEIDDFLSKVDEVLETCPKPMTADGSTGTSGATRKKGRPAAKKPGPKKSTRHLGLAPG